VPPHIAEDDANLPNSSRGHRVSRTVGQGHQGDDETRASYLRLTSQLLAPTPTEGSLEYRSGSIAPTGGTHEDTNQPTDRAPLQAAWGLGVRNETHLLSDHPARRCSLGPPDCAIGRNTSSCACRTVVLVAILGASPSGWHTIGLAPGECLHTARTPVRNLPVLLQVDGHCSPTFGPRRYRCPRCSRLGETRRKHGA
jgi:hypothetical protein